MLRNLLPVLVLVPLLGGCVAVAAASVVGAGVFQYARNEVAQDFPVELAQAWEATLEGLEQLEIVPGESALSATEGRIQSADILVRVERHAAGFTRVRVRVGTFHTADHARRAELVLLEIGAAMERRDELRAWVEKVQQQSAPAPKR